MSESSTNLTNTENKSNKTRIDGTASDVQEAIDEAIDIVVSPFNDEIQNKTRDKIRLWVIRLSSLIVSILKLHKGLVSILVTSIIFLISYAFDQANINLRQSILSIFLATVISILVSVLVVNEYNKRKRQKKERDHKEKVINKLNNLKMTQNNFVVEIKQERLDLINDMRKEHLQEIKELRDEFNSQVKDLQEFALDCQIAVTQQLGQAMETIAKGTITLPKKDSVFVPDTNDLENNKGLRKLKRNMKNT
jgi:hypothetical protein